MGQIIAFNLFIYLYNNILYELFLYSSKDYRKTTYIL